MNTPIFTFTKSARIRSVPLVLNYEDGLPVVPDGAPRTRLRIIGSRRLVEDNGIDGETLTQRISLPRALAELFRQKGLTKATPRRIRELESILDYLFYSPFHCRHGYDCCGCSATDWTSVRTVPGKRREFIVTIKTTYNA